MYLVKSLLTILCFILSISASLGQTGHFNDFDNITNWATGGSSGYTLSNPGGEELQIVANNVGSSYPTVAYQFSTLNLTNHPFLQVKIKSTGNVRVRIDFTDASGRVTNSSPANITAPGDNSYAWYTFDYTGRFNQSWPSAATVDPTQITGLLIYFNPGGNPNFSGTVNYDSLRIGSETVIPAPPKEIKLNQVGFYPDENKMAIISQTDKTIFYVVSQDKQDTLFQANLSAATIWNRSGESVRKADFSAFTSTGSFYLTADSIFSPEFKIENKVHLNLTKGLIKSYYYHRASTAITAPWGEQWTRPYAHADNNVMIHSSAVSAARPLGTSINSSRGWYDAGDYNKYMVNSGISTYTLLALYEHFPTFFDTLNTFIPESGNDIPDLLDEALWNLRWMLTCQDPNDGGVYHKITDPNFNGIQMPHAYSMTRYAVQKSTSATLNFAAVMAQAYRIFRNFETELPDLADSCLEASLKAYDWALSNPSVLYTANPSGISTGVYGDNTVSDEFAWARMELYAATRNDIYHQAGFATANYDLPGWANVRTLGLITLVHYRKQLNTLGYADTLAYKNKLLGLANVSRNHFNVSAYGMPMGESQWNFNWGSNAIAGNQALILIQAYRMTNSTSYLKPALANLDYLLGRNGTGYSFVTGFGSKTPMTPHCRISVADGVVDPLPGMVVGGANPTQDDNCPGYPSSMPARSYVDSWCSYSTNEPAINYTAPVAYVAGAIEAIRAGANYTPEYTTPPEISATGKGQSKINAKIYPNPSKENIICEFENKGTSKITITDQTGKIVIEQTFHGANSSFESINLSELPQGLYLITITTNEGVAIEKLIKE